MLGLYTAFTASRLRVFPDNEGERRYATVAQLVQQATEPSSIILASIHAGPVRYYAGRDTMRFDLLNEEWLDRAVAWLTAQGRHPYILIEDWERPIFEKRFAASNSLGPPRAVAGAGLSRLSDLRHGLPLRSRQTCGTDVGAATDSQPAATVSPGAPRD